MRRLLSDCTVKHTFMNKNDIWVVRSSVVRSSVGEYKGVLETIKFFFGSNRNKPKLNLFRLFFGLFRETQKHFFRFVSVGFGGSDRYRNKRNKQNFVETNGNKPKKSFKKFLLGGSRNSKFFFLGSNRIKPKLNLFLLFLVCFLRNQQIFFSLFRFVSVFRTVWKQPKQTELLVWGIKGDILTHLLLFQLVFCLFRLFRNTKTPCFDIKAKQPKQTSCFG
jgi:hypothetical protein